MSNNYKKFRDMLPAVASILDLSGAADEIESIKDLGYEEDFDGVYTGKIFFNMCVEKELFLSGKALSMGWFYVRITQKEVCI